MQYLTFQKNPENFLIIVYYRRTIDQYCNITLQYIVGLLYVYTLLYSNNMSITGMWRNSINNCYLLYQYCKMGSMIISDHQISD
jgi:hypothetical protein